MWLCGISTTSECDWGVEETHDEIGVSQQHHRSWQYGKQENNSHHSCKCTGSAQFRPPFCTRWMACWEFARRWTRANWVTSPYALTSILQSSKRGQVARVLHAPARDGFYHAEECWCSQYVLSFFLSFALSLDLFRFSSLSLSCSLALSFVCSRAFEFFRPLILALTLIIRTPPSGCGAVLDECVWICVCTCVMVRVCVFMYVIARKYTHTGIEPQYVGWSCTPHMTVMYAQPVTKKQLMTPNQQAANGDPGWDTNKKIVFYIPCTQCHLFIRSWRRVLVCLLFQISCGSEGRVRMVYWIFVCSRHDLFMNGLWLIYTCTMTHWDLNHSCV